MNRLFLIITFIFTFILAGAQTQAIKQEVPVKWTISTHMTGSDTGVLTLTATPSAGWHLYGTTLPEGGPKPTAIDLSGSTGVEFQGVPTPSVKPQTVDDPLFGMQLNWWTQPVAFTLKFKIAAGRTSGRIKAKVNYMACDDHTCMPPASETLFRNVTRRK